MATCHSITYVGDKLIGDPLEIKMFENTKWILSEPGNSNSPIATEDTVLSSIYPKEADPEALKHKDTILSYESNYSTQASYALHIVKRYEFESKLQCMSVVVRQSDKTFKAFVKGSPEKIYELCNKESIPDSFFKALEEYTKKGYRVIALASRRLHGMTYLKIRKLERHKVEENLVFLGFLVMENKLKAATQSTIETLNKCKIRTIMATGDNTLTAISVAQECKILETYSNVL
jgi:cation-transporting ATPase 13A2